MEKQDGRLARGDVQAPFSKKRKLDASRGASGGSAEKIMLEAWKEGTWGATNDISFSIPQRKKLLLEIGFLPEQGLRGRNVATDEIEFAVRWKDIREFFF